MLQPTRLARPLPTAAAPLLLVASLSNTAVVLARDAFGNARHRAGTMSSAGAGAALRVVVSASSPDREADVRFTAGPAMADANSTDLDVRGVAAQEGSTGAYLDEAESIALAISSGIRGAPADESAAAYSGGQNYTENAAPLLLVSVVPRRAGEGDVEARGVAQGASAAAAWSAMPSPQESELEPASNEGPYPALVVPGPSDSFASVVAGTGVSQAIAGVASSLLLQPRDAAGNPTPFIPREAISYGADSYETNASVRGSAIAPASTLPAYQQGDMQPASPINASAWALGVAAAAEAGLIPAAAASRSLREQGAEHVADALEAAS